MPKLGNDFSGLEGQFLDSLNNNPFISMLERRSLLGWDERTYSQIVNRLVGKGIIEKVRVSLGRGAPRVLYRRKGQVPSIKHEYYVHWLITKLAAKGLTCRAEKVGPDIQIPSLKLAINVECGKSNIHGNIPKALESFEKVIVCSDDKKVIENVSRQNQAENILCALVEDVPALFD
jgi:DNA-binding MarR family transcriptional regulator